MTKTKKKEEEKMLKVVAALIKNNNKINPLFYINLNIVHNQSLKLFKPEENNVAL